MNGWETKKLSDVANVMMGQSPDSQYYNEEFLGVKFLQGCTEFGKRFPQSTVYCSKPNKIAPDESILFSVRAPVGRLNIADTNYCIGRGVASIIPTNIDRDYLYLYLDFISRKLQNLSQGSTFESINSTQLNDIGIEKPVDKKEQTAIAQILSTVEKAIEQTEKLVAKYKCIKTGLMQVFLTKGIDEHGNIRSEKTQKFKNSPLGKIPVEWDIIFLGNEKYFSLATGGTPLTTKKEFWENGNIPWLSSGEIHKKIIYYTDNFITKRGYENSNARFYPINSILIALAGQGRTRGTIAITEIELTSNQSISAVIPQKSLIEPYYIYYYLDSLYEELRSISAGSGRASLSLSILSNLEIKLPPKPEQKIITDKLIHIDSLLKKETEYKNKLISLKAGLMQDLLTGKVRVC